MANNSSNTPATEGNDVFTGTSGNDQFTGAHGDDSITGGAGGDTLFGDGPLPGTWHYEVFTRDFSSASGQAFDIETGTRQAYGYVTDFDVGQLANSVQGTSGNPEDFGIVYTSELNVTAGGTYRIATRSDDGSTVQIFDSSGTPVSFANQTGGTLDYMNNDFHQGATTRFGDVILDPNETYTIQIRYWENGGGNVLDATISGPDTSGGTESLLTTSMLGTPPDANQTVAPPPPAPNTTLVGDGPSAGEWFFQTYDYDFSAAAGQAFDIEDGTLTGYGFVSDFDEDALTNTMRGTTGDPSDFGVIYTNTLNVTNGGTYRLTTTSDDGTTIQIFDSAGNALTFANQTGGTLDYMNNDFHQGATTRFGDVVLNGGETYTIQIRYWENLGQDVLSGTISGADTGGVAEDLLTTSMLGLPPEVPLNVEGGVEGNDVINGGAGNDVIAGNGGDDTLTGGLDDDTLTGGDGNDTFVYNSSDGDDTITDFNTGNSGAITDGDQTNNDFLDLDPYYTDLFELRADQRDDGILNQSIGDFTDNPTLGGSITLTGVSDQDLTFDNVNVACFAAETHIKTATGAKRIDKLTEGALIHTQDNGLQPVRWIGRCKVPGSGPLAPVVFEKGAIGNHKRLMVSQEHRMLVTGWRAELFFGEQEVLVPAKLLVNDTTIRLQEVPQITYVHLLFDAHQLIVSEGAVSESFHPGQMGLSGLTSDLRGELLTLFPELVAHAGRLARTAPRANPARLLFA